MVKSITYIVNAVEKEQCIPVQWNDIGVTTFPKNKNKRTLDNQRGIFLSNMISKIYEKVKYQLNYSVVSNMSEMQTGGRKERSSVDNIIILVSIMEKQRNEGKRTYIFFADAVKCFDKLWLKDGLLELRKNGMSEYDIMMLYKLNENADIVIKTPNGYTKSIKVKDTVKQGTTTGPLICCSSTVRVNDINEKVGIRYGNHLEIGMPVFVDDVCAIGCANDIRIGIRNCAAMEEIKKFTYGIEKTKYMVVDTGKEKEEKIEERIEAGIVEKTKVYKYMGVMLNEKGDLKDHLIYKKNKMIGITASIKQIGSDSQVGTEWLKVQLQLYETCLVPSLIYGLEGWPNIKEKEMSQLELLQTKHLKSILKLSESTPNVGLLMETGTWPIKERIEYRILMMYQNLMMSDDTRIIKLLVKEQKDNNIERSFYSKTKEIADFLDINLETVKNKSKFVWKKECKGKIIKKIENRLKDQLPNCTKLRFLVDDNFGRKRYMKELSGNIARQVLKLRLNMIDVRMNYRGSNEGNIKCPLCKTEDDTTEHIMVCGINGDTIQKSFVKSYDWDADEWTKVLDIVNLNLSLRNTLDTRVNEIEQL